MGSKENNLEFLKGSDTATAFFTQGRFISRLKKLNSKHDDCEVIENRDGSILAHFPVSWIKITPPRQLTEEQRQAASERFKNMWNEKNTDNE